MQPGEYAEHEQFLGVMVPTLRIMAREFAERLDFADLTSLLAGTIHEERLLALLVLVRQYQQIPSKRSDIFKFYLTNLDRIDNWDLADLSAPQIVGAFWYDSGCKELAELCQRKNFWHRRVAVVATWFLIRKGEFRPTLEAVGRLLADEEPLIHKASGWMLREIGKRSATTLERFLVKHAARMQRLMLRTALERSPVEVKRKYLGTKRVGVQKKRKFSVSKIAT